MFFFSMTDAGAQCSMCKAVAESNSEGGGAMAVGLNNGILYLMAFPYILIGTIAFFWYRNRKNQRKSTSH